jgi:hypothetical protein
MMIIIEMRLVCYEGGSEFIVPGVGEKGLNFFCHHGFVR